MNREEELDWLYKLRSEIYVYMPKEWLIPMNNALDTAIKALENQKTGHWIPVSERLPEEMGTYMTTIDYEKHGLATGQRYYHGQGLWEDDCVIAWMPLPQPYKAESEDKE